MNKVNIGELIKQKVDERQISVADFAKAINCSRSSVYVIFNSRDISLFRLLEISRVLRYDFIGEICRKSFQQRIEEGHIPFISIPIKDGKADFSSLPKEVYLWLLENGTYDV